MCIRDRDSNAGVTALKFRSGLRALISTKQLLKNGDYDSVLLDLDDFVFVECQKRQSVWWIREFRPLRGHFDYESAQKILNETKFGAPELLLIGFGIKPDKESLRMYMPRILALFRGYDNVPIYCFQLTPHETGKTEFGTRLLTLLDYEYLSEPPTLPRIVVHGKTGEMGFVFTRKGVVFDEFDKWYQFPQRVQTILSTINTGMEQGIWTRGVSDAGGIAPQIRRYINMLFFGNLLEDVAVEVDPSLPPRIRVALMFNKLLGINTEQFFSRIPVIDCTETKYYAYDHVTYNVLPDSILRALVQLIQRNVKKDGETKLKGRLGRHSLRLQSVFKAMNIDIPPNVVDDLVSTKQEWDAVTDYVGGRKT